MRKRRAIFDRLDFQAGRLQGRDGAFASSTWSLDFNVNFLNAKLSCLFGCLLRGTLARKRCTLTTSFEAACSRSRPTQGITLDVGDRDLGVIERCCDIRDPGRHIAASSSFFGFHLPLRHFGLLSHN